MRVPVTKLRSAVCGFACLVALALPARPAAADITIKVGFGVGGGYDTSARLVARHLGKFLDGAQDIHVESVPGAGSLRLAKLLLSAEPADGSVLGTIGSWLAVGPLVDPALEGDDVRGLQWIGGVGTAEARMCAVRSGTEIQSPDALSQADLLFGAPARSAPEVVSKIVRHALGARFRIVTGFNGSAEIRAALLRRELDGYCAVRAKDMQSVFTDGQLRPLLLASYSPHPESGLPHILGLAVDPVDRAAIDLVLSSELFQYAFALPQGASPPIVEAYRNAFDQMVRDADFLAEAAHLKLEPNPITGEALDARLEANYRTPPEVLARARAMVR